MWTDASREAARLAKQARETNVGIARAGETADRVPNYPVQVHAQRQSVGTHDSVHGGGRLGLNPVLAALLGLGAGIASETIKPVLSASRKGIQ
jgi:hypothetical protein